jgi:aryl-alcohol dehydrogenase-like predicted oxidoreductase
MQALALGTAQWGNSYGVTNAEGSLSDLRIRELAQTALNLGIKSVDTAAGYGNAQERLRPWAKEFLVTTKISGVSQVSVATQVSSSMTELGISTLHACLVHDWAALTLEEQKRSAKGLTELQRDGVVTRVGVSAYDRIDIERALEAFSELGCVQIPLSILDQRLTVEESIIKELTSRGAEVQARSIFLQGLLAAESKVALAQHPAVRNFHQWCSNNGYQPLEAAVSFIERLNWIETVIVGVTSAAELEEISLAWNTPIQISNVDTLASQDLSLIDPRTWVKL